MPAPSPNVSDETPTFTSASTQRLVQLAESVLSDESDLAQIEGVLDQLSRAAGDLTDSQREQLDELSQLLRDDPANAPAAEALKQDGSFTLTASEDQMTLYLTVHPPVAGGRAVGAEAIAAELKRRRIRRGVDSRAIVMAAKQAEAGAKARAIAIVRGREAEPGRPAAIELYARPSAEEDLELADPADAAASGRSSLWLCHQGDVILRRRPPTSGRNDFAATGKLLKPPRLAPAHVAAGQNVEARGDDFVAQVSGVVAFDNQRIEVRRMLVVSEDVTGRGKTIDFDGDVHVRAAVRCGAKVIATGNISVDGPVEAAHIESTGGDVTLAHGVAGQNEGMIRAAGRIRARFAENATLSAGDGIVIAIGSLHSRLIAGRAIHISRGRGQMVGGSAMAADLIEVKQAGSPGGVHTELCVGLSWGMMEKLAHLDAEAARLRTRRDEAVELAEKIKRAVGDPMKLQPRERSAYASLRQVHLVCDVKLRALAEQREHELAEAARQTAGHVDVLSSLMPRVVVRIGDATYEAQDTRRACRIVYNVQEEALGLRPLR